MTRPLKFGMLAHTLWGVAMEAEEERAERKRSVFDWIVMFGMVINLVIAIFMILYYFELL